MSSAAAWFLYCNLVAGLLGLAALAGEEAARSAARPSRLLWFLAMLASFTIPGIAYFGPDTWSPPLPAFSDGPILPLAMISVAPPSTDPWSLERLAVPVWLALSAALVVYLVRSYLQLHAARRSWRRERLNGVDVWMTPDIGPAVFGIGQASILMPDWAFELDERLRRLMLLHEEEHARAGDPQLVLAALLVLIAMPWNIVLWWQLRRLRMAVEVDCDGRVLQREPDRRRYGTLLLEVGRRRGGSSLVVAFAEPRAFLERRIRRIVHRSARNIGRAASLTLIALTLFAAAFCARDPSALSAAQVEELVDVVADKALRNDASSEAESAHYTVQPELINPEEVGEALQAWYPTPLRDAGIAGKTVFWLFIDETGRVLATTVHESSGHDVLDDAARRVAGVMRFTPARNGDDAAAVWVRVPVSFAYGTGEDGRPAAAGANASPVPTPDDGSGPSATPTGSTESVATTPEREGLTDDGAVRPRLPEAPEPRTVAFTPVEINAPITAPRLTPARRSEQPVEPPAPRATAASLAAGPIYTPYTRKPALLNSAEVASALRRNYPPLLRDTGVGGTTLVWFLIDEQGDVERRQVHRTSGHSALDDAALAVADQMLFAPAENEGERVPVWVQIPITFASR